MPRKSLNFNYWWRACKISCRNTSLQCVFFLYILVYSNEYGSLCKKVLGQGGTFGDIFERNQANFDSQDKIHLLHRDCRDSIWG